MTLNRVWQLQEFSLAVHVIHAVPEGSPASHEEVGWERVGLGLKPKLSSSSVYDHNSSHNVPQVVSDQSQAIDILKCTLSSETCQHLTPFPPPSLVKYPLLLHLSTDLHVPCTWPSFSGSPLCTCSSPGQSCLHRSLLISC